MHRLRPFAPFVLALVLATPVPAQTNGARPPAGVDRAGMDTTVQPGDSFWQYANGTWLKQAEIPADRSSWGPADVLSELTDRRTADLIKQVATSGAPAGSDRQKIRDYYAAFWTRSPSSGRASPHSSPRSTRSPRSPTARRWAASSAPRFGPTSTSSTRPTSTPRTCWAFGSRRTWTTHLIIPRSWSRAGWGCPTGAITSTRRRQSRKSASSTSRT